MRKTRCIFQLILLVYTLVACSSPVINPQPSPEKVDYPHWVMNPQLDGYLAAVGSAMAQEIGGLESQRRVALLRARADLAKNVRVYVSKQLSIRKQSDAASPQVDQQIKIRAVELQQMDKAIVKSEWLNKKTGELFIWYVVPIK